MLPTKDADGAHALPALRLGRAKLDCPVVAIIGAGFSGTMAAIHLRRTLPPDHVVSLFEQTGRFARGPAYAATRSTHLLNVRASNMSAFPDDPGHFERWLRQNAARWPEEVHASEAGTFATRRLYGRYLRALLYAEMVQSGGRVLLRAGGVRAVEQKACGWRVHVDAGPDIDAVAAVLAVGNLPSTRPSDGIVFYDPWDPRATAALRPNETVLIVGTGLTMVDLVLGMHAQGFAGPVIALSRRGLVPQRHGRAEPPAPIPEFRDGTRQSILALMRAVRHRIEVGAVQGGDWRSVMDGLRPLTGKLWQGLDCDQRARFLRHLRPYWDVYRHRLAPSVADAFKASVEAGSLQLRRGRVTGVEVRPGPNGKLAHVHIQDRAAATAEAIVVQRMIHATGIGAGMGDDGLVAEMIKAGQARQDVLGLGLDVTQDLHVLDASGRAQSSLWALGPIVRGVFWECTAVPDIRVQARMIATGLAHHLGAAPAGLHPG